MKSKSVIRLMFLFFLTVSVVFSYGCSNPEEIKQKQVPVIMENIIRDTETAMESRDTKLARETWSKVTEYSVKAGDYGDEVLAQDLSNLAITYVKLIEYCQYGEENSLQIFKSDFNDAVQKVNEIEEEITRAQA